MSFNFIYVSNYTSKMKIQYNSLHKTEMSGISVPSSDLFGVEYWVTWKEVGLHF